jgi:polar amino acid transport system substrate-binding protein
MKKKIDILFLITSVLAVSIFSQTARADTISIRSDNWCPYACDTSSPLPGYMVEATRAIFAKHGHRIDFKTSDWIDSIKDTRTNKVNALIGCSRADAPDFIFPERPLGQMINHYFVKKTSTWSYRGRQSLEGKRIGVIASYTYGDAVDNLVKTKHKSLVIFSGVDPLGQILKKIEAGELDAFVESPIVLSFHLGNSKQAIDKFKAVSPNLANDPDLYIAFSPNNPKSAQYAEMISKGIDEMRRSGELERILQRYNLTDWLKMQIVASLGVDDFSSGSFHGPFDLLYVLPASRL